MKATPLRKDVDTFRVENRAVGASKKRERRSGGSASTALVESARRRKRVEPVEPSYVTAWRAVTAGMTPLSKGPGMTSEPREPAQRCEEDVLDETGICVPTKKQTSSTIVTAKAHAERLRRMCRHGICVHYQYFKHLYKRAETPTVRTWCELSLPPVVNPVKLYQEFRDRCKCIDKNCKMPQLRVLVWPSVWSSSSTVVDPKASCDSEGMCAAPGPGGSRLCKEVSLSYTLSDGDIFRFVVPRKCKRTPDGGGGGSA